MKILLFLGKGFEIMEMSSFVDVFGWDRHYNQGGIEVVTCGFAKTVVSTFGVPVTVDVLIDEISADDYAALAIPGGFGDFGFYEEAYHGVFLDLIRKFHSQGKILASICVGALPIGKSGILAGHKATTYNQRGGIRQKELQAFGVEIIQEPVVVDGNIITSRGPYTAAETAFTLLAMVRGREASDKTRAMMGF